MVVELLARASAAEPAAEPSVAEPRP
jgi:hypothetical protein